ncbi:MAG: hypothetical protein ACO1G6_01290 [Bacteroidota bacterium]
MKIIVFIWSIILLISCSDNLNNKKDGNKENPEMKSDSVSGNDQSLLIAQELIAKIESDTLNYTVKTLENEEFMEHATDGGGSLTGYFKSGELRKIISWVGLSSCYTIKTFYLEKESLIAVAGLEMDYNYDHATTTIDYSSSFKAYDFTFYFENDQLVSSEFEGRPRCSKKLSDADAGALLEECKSYIFLFSGK